MLCESCQGELEPVMVICPSCGARVRHGREEVNWRQQVRETVERHKAKRRREQARHDDDARQLTIFPDTSQEDEEDRAARARRAEIRARVQERLSKRPASGRVSASDAGNVSLRGGVAAAASLAEEPVAEQRPIDPTTAEFQPVHEEEVDAELSLNHASHVGPDESAAPVTAEPFVAFGLASPGERLLGGLIDAGFVSLIQLTLFYLTTHLVAQRLGALPTSAVVSMSLVGAVLGAGYFLFFWSLSGQTLGKLLTGGRVVDRDGGALGFQRAALRLLGLVASILPLGAGFLGLWTDPERRGWHDRLAGTKVVRG